MKYLNLRNVFIALFCTWLFLFSLAARAVSGYMSFLSTPITVETGDAASYMRVGRDWPPSHPINGGFAQPTLQQKSRITSWRTATHLKFRFEIPDATTHYVDPVDTTLKCGDTVVVQVNPNNSTGTSLQRWNGVVGDERNGDYRYEIVIKNLTITDSAGVPNKPNLYYPNAAGTNWSFAIAQTTGATATPVPPAVGYTYDFTLDIPLSEIGNPTADIGLALAQINDLGHSHGTPAVHEATGTAFPLSMGIAAQSEPGVVLCGGAASGNWVDPSTWGTGYFATPTTADVVFDQTPYPSLSYAIRLGKCNSTWNDILPVPSLAGWDAWQQNPTNNWYLHNPPSATPPPAGEAGPCRMAIWLNPKVMNGASPAPASTLTKRRFLVVWGRPNIGGNDWYVAGLTAPVTVSGADSHVSFIWNNPPAIAFTGHPCMKVYILPENLAPTSGSLPLSPGQSNEDYINGIDTQAKLTIVENAFGLPGSNRVAQMNFSNIGNPGGCTDSFCLPLISLNRSADLQFASHRGWSLMGQAYAAGPELATRMGTSVKDRPTEKQSPRVFIMATGFGVAAPQGKARYVYVEETSNVAWAMPSSFVGTTIKSLRFEKGNPRVAAWHVVNGKTVEIPAPARTLFVAMEAAAPAGTPLPRFDTKNLQEQTRGPIEPGKVLTVEVGVQGSQCNCACGDVKCMAACDKQTASMSGSAAGTFALLGSLGVGGLAFWRRKRKGTGVDAGVNARDL